MDILSHGFWAGATYKIIGEKTKKRFNFWLAVFWGIFPDVFAFAIPFSWLILGLFSGNLNPSDLPGPPHYGEPAAPDTFWVFRLANILYNISHSLAIFLAVFVIVWLALRRPVWELGGWLIHILIDIPTHSYQFYPTPFLWPVSGWKFNGLSWGAPWFLALDYLAMIIVYFLVFKRKRRIRES